MILYCVKHIQRYFIRRFFDFLPFSVLKLHFQHLIFAKILYNEFLSLIVGFLQPYEKKFVDIMMLYCVKIYLEGYFIHRIFDFLPFSVLKLHFQRLIFAKIQYNEFLSLINGFLQPYQQKFVNIMMLYCVKNIFRGYFIHRIFDFLLLSVIKLHFQRLIFAKIQYNEFLSLIIGFLQPYQQKFVNIIMPYCVKIYLEDISSVESLIFYRFPC